MVLALMLLRLVLMPTWLVETLPKLLDTLLNDDCVAEPVVETADKFESVVDSALETLLRLDEIVATLALCATWLAETLPRLVDTPASET